MKKPLAKNPKKQSLKVSLQIFGIKQLVKSPCKTTWTKISVNITVQVQTIFIFFSSSVGIVGTFVLSPSNNNVYIFEETSNILVMWCCPCFCRVFTRVLTLFPPFPHTIEKKAHQVIVTWRVKILTFLSETLSTLQLTRNLMRTIPPLRSWGSKSSLEYLYRLFYGPRFSVYFKSICEGKVSKGYFNTKLNLPCRKTAIVY